MDNLFADPASERSHQKDSEPHANPESEGFLQKEQGAGNVNRLHVARSEVNKALLRERSREELLQRICEIMVGIGGYRLAWIGWLNPKTGVVVPAAAAGEPAQEYLHSIRVTANDRAEGQGPTGTAIREGASFVCNDFLADERTRPWHEAAKRAGVNSSAAFPFRHGSEVCGSLNVYSSDLNFFQGNEVALLEEVAADISYGLEVREAEVKRRQEESALRENEDRFRGFAEAADEVFWIMSLHPELILYVNPAFDKIWGLPSADLYCNPRLWMDSIYIDDRPHIMESFANWVEDIPGSRYDVEYRIVRPDGEIRWIADKGFVLSREKGTMSHVAGIAQDITERKHSEEALQKSEERFRGTLDSLMEGCMIIGSDWTYLYVNEAAARHGHQEVNHLIGRTMMEMYPGVEDSGVFAKYRQCMKERTHQRFESKYTFANGTAAWYEFRVAPVPEGIFVLSLDITERKRAENTEGEDEGRSHEVD